MQFMTLYSPTQPEQNMSNTIVKVTVPPLLGGGLQGREALGGGGG